jgi:hypothetical protein
MRVREPLEPLNGADPDEEIRARMMREPARARGGRLVWAAVPLLAACCIPPCAAAEARVQLSLDATEADQVLVILALRHDRKPIEEGQWQKLFATEPYQRLKQREKKIGEQFRDPTVAFSDEDFKNFVLSENLLKQAQGLQEALERWKRADMYALAERVLPYLPASAKVRAKVYPAIKPAINSFVWETSSNPAIFLYLDPEVSREKFENNVAHELHHIGLASAQAAYEQTVAALPERSRAAANWMGAFGEGLAMLAAAGGPDVDPHAASSAAEHARWDHDMANFATDLRSLDRFFLDVLDGKFANQDAVDEKASAYFGAQGPWYTVGYKMAVMVERRFGRDVLIQTMLDPRLLLVRYNQAAREQDRRNKEPLPLWSEQLLEQVQAPTR